MALELPSLEDFVRVAQLHWDSRLWKSTNNSICFIKKTNKKKTWPRQSSVLLKWRTTKVTNLTAVEVSITSISSTFTLGTLQMCSQQAEKWKALPRCTSEGCRSLLRSPASVRRTPSTLVSTYRSSFWSFFQSFLLFLMSVPWILLTSAMFWSMPSFPTLFIYPRHSLSQTEENLEFFCAIPKVVMIGSHKIKKWETADLEIAPPLP